MCAGRYDATFVQQHDQVCVAHCADALCDDEAGASVHQLVERLLDLIFCFSVYCAGAVVKNQNARVEQQRARDGDALLLSAAQADAAFTDECFVAVGE